VAELTTPARASLAAHISSWIARRQRAISNVVHAGGDAIARAQGWEITASTGRLGFGARSYRAPRFGQLKAQRAHADW
jgi:hypothetical protein